MSRKGKRVKGRNQLQGCRTRPQEVMYPPCLEKKRTGRRKKEIPREKKVLNVPPVPGGKKLL